MKPQGVYVATVTPFLPDGSLDLTSYQKHIRFLIDSGVNGLVPCGTTGESPTLTQTEWARLVECCLEAAQGKKVQVIAGCGGNATEKVLDSLQHAKKQGCDAAMVVTPYYNKPTPAGLLAHYLSLADRSEIPLILYHVPGRTNVSLPLDIVARLFEHSQIVGMKEASGQYSYWLGLAQIARDLDKALLAGDDDAFAVLQAFGGKGIVSASANALPASYVQLNQLLLEGAWQKAFDLQLKLAPLVRAFFAETNPAPIKYALHKYRGMTNALRLPLVPVAQSTERLIVQEWERYSADGLL